MGGGRTRHVARVVGRLLAEQVRARRAKPGEGTEEQARAVREALQELGPFYIKVGQMLSTRPDFVPPAVLEELGQLHDQVAPAPFSTFEPVLAAELGPRWRRLFKEVDTSAPLGAASLAQVYRARLADGSLVAVKVQRPGVEEVMAGDIRLLRRAARLLARAAPRFTTVVDVPAMLGVLFEAMEAETDFRVEAGHMHRARELCEEFTYLSVPEVLLPPTRRVLVQALAPGVSIRDADPGAFTAAQRAGIGRDLMAFMFRGYFLDRFFHADPHPGNIFVAPGEPAHLIDWGMVGRMESGTSRHLVLALLNLAANDGAGLAATWIDMGTATTWADVAGFRSDISLIVPRIASVTLEELNFGVTLTAVLAHATRRGIRTSPVISLLGKSFANLEGAIRYLCPELSITDVFADNLRTVVFGLARETLSEQQAARTALDLMIAAPGALQQTRGILRAFAEQDLTFHAKVAGEDDRRKRATDAGSWPFWAALALAGYLARGRRR
ncbi:ABC1 kinase family protein [Streptomyces sp. NPDC008001]|uniref:ABC1 kinase family protein n=1 Tax=Streptomyces sp. NPDC008001 TaxID=3364804 RepID=UPI0036EE0195